MNTTIIDRCPGIAVDVAETLRYRDASTSNGRLGGEYVYVNSATVSKRIGNFSLISRILNSWLHATRNRQALVIVDAAHEQRRWRL